MSFKLKFVIPGVAALCLALIGATKAAYADLSDPLYQILAGDGGDDYNFGHAVSISGTRAIIGTPGDDVNDFNSGSAYLFDTLTAQQLFKLIPLGDVTEDQFGYSVAISGLRAIAGAPFYDSNIGTAYIFDVTTGQQLFQLLAIDGQSGDELGTSIAISGIRAIAGAPRDDDNGSNAGSAYLFDATTGQQLFKLLPNDGVADDQFGFSVAISGTRAIVGSRRDDDNGSESGAAYVFDATTGQQLFKLLPRTALPVMSSDGQLRSTAPGPSSVPV